LEGKIPPSRVSIERKHHYLERKKLSLHALDEWISLSEQRGVNLSEPYRIGVAIQRGLVGFGE
jgi:hypothetical protein